MSNENETPQLSMAQRLEEYRARKQAGQKPAAPKSNKLPLQDKNGLQHPPPPKRPLNPSTSQSVIASKTTMKPEVQPKRSKVSFAVNADFAFSSKEENAISSLANKALEEQVASEALARQALEKQLEAKQRRVLELEDQIQQYQLVKVEMSTQTARNLPIEKKSAITMTELSSADIGKLYSEVSTQTNKLQERYMELRELSSYIESQKDEIRHYKLISKNIYDQPSHVNNEDLQSLQLLQDVKLRISKALSDMNEWQASLDSIFEEAIDSQKRYAYWALKYSSDLCSARTSAWDEIYDDISSAIETAMVPESVTITLDALRQENNMLKDELDDCYQVIDSLKENTQSTSNLESLPENNALASPSEPDRIAKVTDVKDLVTNEYEQLSKDLRMELEKANVVSEARRLEVVSLKEEVDACYEVIDKLQADAHAACIGDDCSKSHDEKESQKTVRNLQAKIEALYSQIDDLQHHMQTTKSLQNSKDVGSMTDDDWCTPEQATNAVQNMKVLNLELFVVQQEAKKERERMVTKLAALEKEVVNLQEREKTFEHLQSESNNAIRMLVERCKSLEASLPKESN